MEITKTVLKTLIERAHSPYPLVIANKNLYLKGEEFSKRRKRAIRILEKNGYMSREERGDYVYYTITPEGLAIADISFFTIRHQLSYSNYTCFGNLE